MVMGRALRVESEGSREPAHRQREARRRPRTGEACGQDEILEKLAADGLVTLDEGGPHLTRQWQCAMARAALRLYQAGDRQQDIRVPIAFALVDMYEHEPDERIARYVRALLPLETAENRRACGRRAAETEADGSCPLWFK